MSNEDDVPPDWVLEAMYNAPSAAGRPQRTTYKLSSQPGTVGGYTLAKLWHRWASGLIDFGIAFVVPGLVLGGGFSLYGWWMVLGFLIQVANGGVAAALTGRSAGKVVMKMRLVQVRQEPGGTPFFCTVPLVTAVLRVVLHYLDAYSVIGFLLPYWSKKRAAISDLLVKTYVVRDDDLPDPEPYNAAAMKNTVVLY